MKNCINQHVQNDADDHHIKSSKQVVRCLKQKKDILNLNWTSNAKSNDCTIEYQNHTK